MTTGGTACVVDGLPVIIILFIIVAIVTVLLVSLIIPPLPLLVVVMKGDTVHATMAQDVNADPLTTHTQRQCWSRTHEGALTPRPATLRAAEEVPPLTYLYHYTPAT